MNHEPLSVSKRVRFVELSAKALRALADGDLAGGSAEAGVESLTRTTWSATSKPLKALGV